MRHALVVGLAVLALASSARADDASQAALAERLFRDGRALVTEGRLREACEKFAESRRLDPAPGTLLNLARCYEDVGRTASAWATYRELELRAVGPDQATRASFAHRRIAELEPTLAALVVHVAPESRVPGLAVGFDDVEVGAGGWETRVPVDPGRHRLVARAPGYAAWSRDVDVAPSARVDVDVGPLVPLAAETTPAPAAPRASPLRTVGIATTIAGGVGLLTGLALGGVAKIENDGARRDECDARGCTAAGLRRIGHADDFATASTAVVIGASVVTAAGVAIWLLAPRTSVRAGVASLAVEHAF